MNYAATGPSAVYFEGSKMILARFLSNEVGLSKKKLENAYEAANA
jgi:hypothetical protein